MCCSDSSDPRAFHLQFDTAFSLDIGKLTILTLFAPSTYVPKSQKSSGVNSICQMITTLFFNLLIFAYRATVILSLSYTVATVNTMLLFPPHV